MVDRDEVTAALDSALGRFAALLRRCTTEEATQPVPATPEWTVADTGAHVLTVFRRALTDFRRSETPEGLAELNATCLAEVGERDPLRLAEMIERDGKQAIHVTLPALPTDLRFPFHGGIKTTVVPAGCVLLGELLVHGHDLAAALSQPWLIPESTAVLVLRGTAPLTRAWRRPHADDGAVQIDLPGGPPLRLGAGPVRHEVRGIDPVTVMLAFPYQRITPPHPGLAALAAAHHLL